MQHFDYIYEKASVLIMHASKNNQIKIFHLAIKIGFSAHKPTNGYRKIHILTNSQ